MNFKLQLKNQIPGYKWEDIMEIEFDSTDERSIEAIAKAVGETLRAYLTFKANQISLGVEAKEE